jgi:hypothetical protein
MLGTGVFWPEGAPEATGVLAGAAPPFPTSSSVISAGSVESKTRSSRAQAAPRANLRRMSTLFSTCQRHKRESVVPGCDGSTE